MAHGPALKDGAADAAVAKQGDEGQDRRQHGKYAEVAGAEQPRERHDGRDVNNFNALRSMVAQTELNKKVALEIMRDGKALMVSVQIKEQPVDYQTSGSLRRPAQPPSQPQAPGSEGQEAASSPLASIHVDELTPELARQLDLPSNIQGVVVTSVDPDSGAAELQKGDVIEEINQQPVTSVADYNRIGASLNADQPQVLSVCRHRMRSFLVLRPR